MSHLRMTDEQLAERATRLAEFRGRERGGIARAAALKPARRTEIAKTAAKARWDAPRKPPKAKPPTEHQEQAAVIEWWDKTYAPAHKLDPRLLFAIPNGAHKSFAQAAKFKKEGLRSGSPDLMLAIPKNCALLRRFGQSIFSGLFIEMKRIKGKASPEQIEFATLLRNQGYNTIIAEGAAEAMRAITGYLES